MDHDDENSEWDFTKTDCSFNITFGFMILFLGGILGYYVRMLVE